MGYAKHHITIPYFLSACAYEKKLLIEIISYCMDELYLKLVNLHHKTNIMIIKCFRRCLLLLLFANAVDAQECARNKENMLTVLTEKKSGWEWIDTNPVSFDVDNCPKTTFHFVFQKQGQLQINKQIIDCKGNAKTTASINPEYHIIDLKNGYNGIKIDQVNPDIGLVVRKALRPDEIRDTEFEFLCENNKIILRTYTSRHQTIENKFK
jgi:hypothetical protein